MAARSLVRAIALSGWTPVVLNARYPRSMGHSEVRIPGIKPESLNSLKIAARSIFESILELAMLPILFAREIRAKTSVVHLVNCFMLPRALLRLIVGIPVIAHVYQNPTPMKPKFPLPVDAFIASSLRIAKILQTHHSERIPIFTVPPAVDTHFFQTDGEPSARRKIGLYMGNLSCGRFPNELFGILREVTRIDPGISFRIIASVNRTNIARANEIREICKSLRIQDKVIVSIRDIEADEKRKEYLAAKCLVFAPIREGREAIEPPLTVLEALASGLPVLATDTYSVREAVIPGKNGFLVSVENYTDLVDSAISIFQADRCRWHGWSLEARRIAISNFSISYASRRLANMYSTVLGN